MIPNNHFFQWNFRCDQNASQKKAIWRTLWWVKNFDFNSHAVEDLELKYCVRNGIVSAHKFFFLLWLRDNFFHKFFPKKSI